ncbi:hypothetical protein POM88_004206 [Heracleum sosnowskyi]|uniref:Cytochrome b561 domain-containing protein n=1 Tax=Heracleum sosnowskyi TaxID=360622 RepID=A0AAD8JJ22_9APIA|nr:hypothetical protein POM88_004206 [Heracleum sosnowskyi]
MTQVKKAVFLVVLITSVFLTLPSFTRANDQEHVESTDKILSVLLVTTGAVLSIRKFENTFNNTHQKMGLALYGVIWLQALTGFFRPERRVLFHLMATFVRGHVGRQHMARKWKGKELRRGFDLRYSP